MYSYILYYNYFKGEVVVYLHNITNYYNLCAHYISLLYISIYLIDKKVLQEANVSNPRKGALDQVSWWEIGFEKCFNIYFYNYKVTNVVKSERFGPQGTQPANTFLLSDDVKDGKNTRQILSLRGGPGPGPSNML